MITKGKIKLVIKLPIKFNNISKTGFITPADTIDPVVSIKVIIRGIKEFENPTKSIIESLTIFIISEKLFKTRVIIIIYWAKYGIIRSTYGKGIITKNS